MIYFYPSSMDSLPIDILALILSKLSAKNRFILSVNTTFTRAIHKSFQRQPVNLSYSIITDHGLQHLQGVHTIYHRWCNQITDHGLSIVI